MNRRQILQLLAGSAATTATAPLLGSVAESAEIPGKGTVGYSDRLRAEQWNRDRRFADISFGKIAYCDTGEGPAALFIHGFPLNSFQWRSSIETLSSFYRCVAPDLMGMGFTRPVKNQDLTPPAQARMLAELLDHLKIGRVHIVANDSGGAIAQLFAVNYPDRVGTMLFTNCDTEFECPPAAIAPAIADAHQDRFAKGWLLPWFNDRKLARSSKGLGGLCYVEPANLTDAAIDIFLGPLVAGPDRMALTDGYAIALEQNVLAGIGEKLKRLTQPARILWGTRDPIFSRAGANHLDRSLGNSRGIRWISDGMLFWPEEQPKIIVEEALALWSHRAI